MVKSLFNIKAALGNHAVIQKKGQELLAKGIVELSPGGVGFYSNVFVVPKNMSGLQPVLNF